MKLSEFPNIQQNHPLAQYSAYQIGGSAKFFFDLKDISLLPSLIKAAINEKIPYRIIGGGTNILFKDEGFEGLIIRFIASGISWEEPFLVALSGTRIPIVLLAAQKEGFNSLNAFIGLPGTIGGAAYGNAGAAGLESKDFIEKVELYNPEKGFYFLTNQNLEFGYRTSILKEKNITDPICRVFIRVAKNKQDLGRDLSLKARESQPMGLSCGCWFTNPPGNSAGKLIDEAGLKGLRVGGAFVSDKHANFLVNDGTATASDLINLANKIKDVVLKKHNIQLKDEVRVI